MKLSDIEQGLASGKLASELSLKDWNNKLSIIYDRGPGICGELDDILEEIEGEDRDCALCIKYVKSEHTCKNCPLIIVDPNTCFSRISYYGVFSRASNYDDLVSATKDMISALEKAVDIDRGSRNE
jgi:hypothetical protein